MLYILLYSMHDSVEISLSCVMGTWSVLVGGANGPSPSNTPPTTWSLLCYCRRGAGDTSSVAGQTSSRQTVGGKENLDKVNTVYALTYNNVQSVRKRVLFINCRCTR